MRPEHVNMLNLFEKLCEASQTKRTLLLQLLIQIDQLFPLVHK